MEKQVLKDKKINTVIVDEQKDTTLVVDIRMQPDTLNKKNTEQKNTVKERRDWTLSETIVNKRLEKAQEIQDLLLANVLANKNENEFNYFPELTLKVFRGGKLKFCKCSSSFNHLGKVFYFCEHEVRNENVSVFFKSETENPSKQNPFKHYFEEYKILKSYNPILK